MRGNECLWWQWSTLAKGSTVVWIAEAEAAQTFWGLTEHSEICRGRRDAYAGLCFQKAVIMSFTPIVWLSCRSLTHFIRRSFSLSVACGLSVPVDGRRVWGCGFLLWSWWKREARQHGSHSNFVYYLWAPVLFSHGSPRPWKMALDGSNTLYWGFLMKVLSKYRFNYRLDSK